MLERSAHSMEKELTMKSKEGISSPESSLIKQPCHAGS